MSYNYKSILNKMVLPAEVKDIISSTKDIIMPENREHLFEMAMGGGDNTTYDVEFSVGDALIREVTVCKCKNGIAVNYDDIYMRRRDPDSMVIADDLPTDKMTHEKRFGKKFGPIRQEAFNWLKKQKSLIFMPFFAGNEGMGIGYPALVILPANSAFFSLALSDLQGFIPADNVPNFFKPKAIVYVAPPFRHTHYEGKQVVIHNRTFDIHEIFSFNLYPGPSAKKGIYSVLINVGEQEKWLTLHASTVKVMTPYELTTVIMHEGASGGGKSEMLEHFHRMPDGRILLGHNIVTDEDVIINMADPSELYPVTDDMALCHPTIMNDSGKINLCDAEDGWFVRVNHITNYGTDPALERSTIHPKEPLVFLNIDAVPDSTALIWEHIMDAPNKRCANPRVILPRSYVYNHVDDVVDVDVRSFGLRQPPSTKDNPNFGIAGIFHVLPPALAWLWRLAAPRGHDNPSITDSAGMQSEGVGSYWPFATGKMVDQANLLLKQILKTPETRFILIPNQYVGAYKVGFSGQWITREYIARRGGAKFRREQLVEARCPLLGYALDHIRVEGVVISKGFLQTNYQTELGNEGYDAGAKKLNEFFKSECKKFLTPDLLPLGKQIIEACLAGASVEDYYNFIPKL